MSFLPQQNNSYSEFGFEPEKEENTPDYTEFGFSSSPEDNQASPQEEKAGYAESILNGFKDAFLGIPALAQYGFNEYNKAKNNLWGVQNKERTFEEENPLLSYLGKSKEGKDETARRLRTGVAGATLGAVGGIPGILAGLIGSQAGQTVREVYGKEGKFENFGWGEAGAIGLDVLTGAGAGIIGSAVKGAGRQAANVARTPSIFKSGESALERASIKHVVQGEKNALQTIINDFSRSQLTNFEAEASAISPQKYNELTNANLAGIQRNADNMFKQGQLSLISPLNVTPEQGGRAIQEAANEIFQQEVIVAEREAYKTAKDAAKGVSGSAPRTLEEAIALRDKLVSTTPSPEQNSTISYLNGLIEDLHQATPASTLVGPDGKPLTAATSGAATRTGEEMIDLVQKGNQAVNYSSEAREQSHRLKPILNTLREETGQVLRKNPKAEAAYSEANTLHARNAETWGTKYMRNVRFSETPEDLITRTAKPSNLRNLKLAIPNIEIQNVAERLVVDKITTGGKSASNAATLRDVAPELSPNAQNAANELINVKDPLTTTGGRAVVRNEILKDAAQAVNTGKRPEKILTLMETPKGYNLVRETMNHSPQGRRVFNSFERLFIEDIVSSISDSSGKIDFSKAANIFKNREVRQVTEMIGGQGIVQRFDQLENVANNLQKNIALYSNPETQSLLKTAVGKVKSAGIAGSILHSLHVPWPIIVGLGLAKTGGEIGKAGFKAIQRKVLTNPEAIHILERISRATTKEELAKQIPRLISQIENSDSKNEK